MLLTIAAVTIVWVFLPQVAALFDITSASTGTVGQCLRLMMNVRYKIIALLHFSRPLYSGEIDEIIVYPMKGMSYMRVKEWEVDEYGIKHDRQFMCGYWDEASGMYLGYSAVTAPRFSLVKISCDLEENWFEFSYPILDDDGESSGGKFGSFRLPCDVNQKWIDANITESELKTTTVWIVKFEAYCMGNVLPEDFKKSMKLTKPGTTLLFTTGGKQVRAKAPAELKNFRTTLFQAYYPLLLMTKEEIDEVNDRLEANGFERHVDAIQFRPNIVVKGLPKLIDDVWKFRFRNEQGQTHNWQIAQKCPRCSYMNVDLEKGKYEKTNAVSKTLDKYRRVDAGGPKQHYLGQYAVHMDHGYRLKVGDRIEVMEEKVVIYEGI